MPAEQRGASDCREATNGHLKDQELQRRLYLRSKRERRCRFYSLYDKVCHADILREAWIRVKRNKGAGGVDGYGIREIEEKIGTSLIRYADDFIVVSRHSEKWLLSKTRDILEGEWLKINEEKSKVVDVEKEAVRFLGFEIKLARSRRRGRKFALMYPSKKAMKGLYEKIRAMANPRMPIAIETVIARLNRLLRGWVNYFRIGHASRWFSKVRYYVEKKVRRYIRRVRNKAGYGWKRISGDYLYKDLGLYNDYRVSWRRA